MESKHLPQPRDDRDEYEAPVAVELGTLAEVTAGVVDFPSCRY